MATVIESKSRKESSGECKQVAPFPFVGVTFMLEGVVGAGLCGVPVERRREGGTAGGGKGERKSYITNVCYKWIRIQQFLLHQYVYTHTSRN